MEEIVTLRYEGEKIRAQKGMDAYDVAEAIDSFADFIRSISDATLGESSDLRLTIQGFRRGSLEIQFVFELAALAQTILGSVEGLTLRDAIKQVFELLKHLQGKSPKSTKQADRGSVVVENNEGKITVVNGNIYNVVINGDVSQSAERFVGNPLRDAADKVEISVGKQVTAQADRKVADSFVTLGTPQALGEFRSELHLTIQTVVLEGDGQWRFSDGRNKFRAAIQDENFLQRVREGKERFGRGDILKVHLKSVQQKIKGQLQTTHVIEKVISHQRSIGDQADFFRPE